jgi:hypothetical protein
MGFARLFEAEPVLPAGGQIGIVVPAVLGEFGADVPAELAPCWDWEYPR